MPQTQTAAFFMQTKSLRHKDTGSKITGAKLSAFLSKTALYQLDKTVYSSFFVSTVSNDSDSCTAYDTEGKDTKKALSVYSALFLFDPDRGLELICLLDEECCRTCVKTNLILNHYIFNVHNTSLLSYTHILINDI